MTTQTKATGTKPTHRLFVVSGEGKGNWQPIGAAWPNRDGQGFSITVNGVSVRFAMRTITEKPAKGGQQ
jgi:hypothetical protein